MELSQQIQGLTDKQGELLKAMEDTTEALKAKDANVEELKARLDTLGAEMATVTAERTAREKDALLDRAVAEINAIKSQIREPSKASLIGSPKVDAGPGDVGFLWALWASKSTRYPELNAFGKARLEEMGSYWAPVPADSKATLGDTAAAGGNIVPANVLTSFIEIQTAENPYRRLLDVQPVGFVAGVDVPTEGLAPTRAQVVGYGATKPNKTLTTNKYSATMYTIAEIYDVGNQLLRNSRGTAERNVRSRLARAFALGESYYILQGSGTNEPKGILTSIGSSGTFVTSFTPYTAGSPTLAGSAAAAIATAAADVANRSVIPTGGVVNAKDFWLMVAQGTDTAGFFIEPRPRNEDPTGLRMTIWGLDIVGDPNMPTDNLVVGGFKSAVLFTGDAYRVDVSDQAGDRWDKNETGFRGEEEIGFNADPYVATGHFQRITNLMP